MEIKGTKTGSNKDMLHIMNNLDSEINKSKLTI